MVQQRSPATLTELRIAGKKKRHGCIHSYTERCIKALACRHSLPLSKTRLNKQATLYTHAHTHTLSGQRTMVTGCVVAPPRLFARCRSMGIECGQGGLKINMEPLQRCAYWDMREEVGVKIHLCPLMWSSLLHWWEVLLNMSTGTHMNTD